MNKCREASRSHTLHHSSNREGNKPNLGTAEVPMSRGDKETKRLPLQRATVGFI